MLNFSQNTSKKHIYLLSDLLRTSAEHWQKNLNREKGQEMLHITGQNKQKKERKEKESRWD